jgi:adenylate kinase family enzyme
VADSDRLISSLICLSGPIGAGKSELAKRLEASLTSAVRVSTRRMLTERGAIDRASLQALGAHLDRQTDGQWVREALQRVGDADRVIVDAIRTRQQLAALSTNATVSIHIHLKASRATLQERYEAKRGKRPERELSDYSEVLRDSTEANVAGLAFIADRVLDTDMLLPQETLDEALGVLASREATAKEDGGS